MLSRVAENLYWAGRYVQRAENTARLIGVNANLLLDLPRGVTFGWQPLVDISGGGDRYRELYKEADETGVVKFLVLDERNPGSILSSLRQTRECLRTTREWIPSEVWERINDLYLFVKEKGERGIVRGRRQEFLDQVVDGALRIYGMFSSNMSRDVGFQFLRIGTNLEQADMTTRILDVRSTTLILRKGSEALAPFQNIQWMSVLKSLTAYQMYRRTIKSRVNGPGVLKFLLQDRDFPRSVMFSLGMIASTLPRLPPQRKVERALQRTRALVQDANVAKLIEAHSSEAHSSEDKASELHRLVDEIQVGLAELHEAVSQAYFKA